MRHGASTQIYCHFWGSADSFIRRVRVIFCGNLYILGK